MSMMINNNFDPGFTVSITIERVAFRCSRLPAVNRSLEEFLRELPAAQRVEFAPAPAQATAPALSAASCDDELERWDGLS